MDGSISIDLAQVELEGTVNDNRIRIFNSSYDGLYILTPIVR